MYFDEILIDHNHLYQYIFYLEIIRKDHMTFLYCNDRWKQMKQNTLPGPGNYEISSKPDNEDLETVKGRFQKIFRRNKKGKQICKTTSEIRQRQMTQIQETVGEELVFVIKPSIKKGKIYKSSSTTAFMNLINQQTTKNEDIPDCNLFVNNITHQPSVASKNVCRDLRADDMQNRHSQNEMKRKYLKTASSSKKFTTLAARQSRQRYLQDLKELENVFNYTRKGASQSATKSFTKNHAHSLTYFNKKRTLRNLKEAEQIQKLAVEAKMICHYELVSPLHTKKVIIEANDPTNQKLKSESNKQTLQTALQDQSFQESVQYIDDATPGPGSYEIRRQISKNRPMTHIQKFGVTIDRFQSAKITSSKSQAQIQLQYPKFKKQSMAPQYQVGFGKSTKKQIEQRVESNDLFYQDPNNLEHKKKKLLLKAKRENVGFQSCKERFNQEIKKDILDSSSSSEQFQIQQEVKNKKQRPNGIFLSKVQRDLLINDITEVVDFQGQNHYCLGHKILKQKQRSEDYQLQTPGFMGGSQRFPYPQADQTDKNAQLRLIKIEEIKKKEEKRKKIAEKGYSFIKGERNNMMVNNSCRQDNPSPDKYNLTLAWIKDSYNLRFHKFQKQ